MTQAQPVAVCTVCRAISYSMTGINGPCGRTVGGRRCRGVNGSALNENDWAVCDQCTGTGSVDNSRCQYCSGAGWLYIRS